MNYLIQSFALMGALFVAGFCLAFGFYVFIAVMNAITGSRAKGTSALSEMQRRNNLPEDQNAILRISAGSAVDLKRSANEILNQLQKSNKKEAINE